jgi:hypothetical protein
MQYSMEEKVERIGTLLILAKHPWLHSSLCQDCLASKGIFLVGQDNPCWIACLAHLNKGERLSEGEF